jgi:succinate dehydrogenase flavin-adding protein (antitoxin of CptAB toxin-antitoxin module)
MPAGRMDRAERDRLKWKCRRGLLELDLVLESFLRREGDGLDSESVERLNELLELPDNDLWDIVAGRSESFAPAQRELVARLRAS